MSVSRELIEKMVEEIVSLRARVAALETKETGGKFKDVTVSGGLNVGTATGAQPGEIIARKSDGTSRLRLIGSGSDYEYSCLELFASDGKLWYAGHRKLSQEQNELHFSLYNGSTWIPALQLTLGGEVSAPFAVRTRITTLRPWSTDSDVQVFKTPASGLPLGWVAVDAPFSSDIAQTLPGYWTMWSGWSKQTWKVRKLTNKTDSGHLFWFGPILTAGWITMVSTYSPWWRIGMYSGTSSAIDETKFTRVNIWWDGTNKQWKVQGEYALGGSISYGATVSLGQVWPFPVYILVHQGGGVLIRQGISIGVPYVEYPTLLNDAYPGSFTWGNVWLQIEHNGGSVWNRCFSIGAISYGNAA